MSDKGAPTVSSAAARAARRTSSHPVAAGRFPLPALLVAALVAAGVSGTSLRAPEAQAAMAAASPAAEREAAPAPLLRQPQTAPAAARAVSAVSAPRVQFPALGSDAYYAQLRSQVRWLPARVDGRALVTPDVRSRLLLVQSAAAQAGLEEVGLNWRDVYGVINAETTWVPRTGMGKNGVPSLGIAQFEPATAKAVGLRNPDDAVESVHAAAVLLKEAAGWSSRKIAPLGLDAELHAAKLREGVSVYYNLSSRARREWSGLNTATLPVETRRHIANVRRGAQEAGQLLARVGSVELPPAAQQVALDLPAADEAPRAAPRKAAPVRRSAKAREEVVAQAAPPQAGPIRVSQRDGRTTWTLPQGVISWSAPASRS